MDTAEPTPGTHCSTNESTLNRLKMKIMVRAFRIRIKDGENFEDIVIKIKNNLRHP